eukprot:m.18055 g.18055  ORF g.18055 m.18055 type:complete len:63 (+) comp6179_c0_seq2:1002-1190(+)
MNYLPYENMLVCYCQSKQLLHLDKFPQNNHCNDTTTRKHKTMCMTLRNSFSLTMMYSCGKYC